MLCGGCASMGDSALMRALLNVIGQRLFVLCVARHIRFLLAGFALVPHHRSSAWQEAHEAAHDEEAEEQAYDSLTDCDDARPTDGLDIAIANCELRYHTEVERIERVSGMDEILFQDRIEQAETEEQLDKCNRAQNQISRQRCGDVTRLTIAKVIEDIDVDIRLNDIENSGTNHDEHEPPHRRNVELPEDWDKNDLAENADQDIGIDMTRMVLCSFDDIGFARPLVMDVAHTRMRQASGLDEKDRWRKQFKPKECTLH